MIGDTSKFKIHDIVYNKGGFAVARGYWGGNPELRLACRWHEEGGMGYPQTFGKPQWMVLPDDDIALDVGNALASPPTKITITLN